MTARIRITSSLTLAWYAGLITGCGGEPERAMTGVSVDTLASGRVVVTNPAEGRWTEDSAWTLVEDLRLGCVEGCGPELFSQVAYILTDEGEENLYALDYPSQEIRVFASDGSHVRTLGGLGDGPGELRGAAGLDWGPDGNLWVWGGQRYQVIDASGAEVDRYARPVRGVIYPWMGGFTPDGRYVDYGVDFETLRVDREGDFVIPVLSGAGSLPVVALDPSTSEFDTLPDIDFPVDITEDGRRKRFERSFVGIQDAEGHLWFAFTDPYVVHRRTLEGDTLLSFSRPGQPVPVSASLMDSLIAERARSPFPGPGLERSDFATHHWLVTNVLTDGTGHVFVFPNEVGAPQGSAVDVFTEDGIYLGRMTFPETVLTEGPPPHITDRHIYAVVENELEIPFVVRYRIQKP